MAFNPYAQAPMYGNGYYSVPSQPAYQSYIPNPQQQNSNVGIIWVDGEVGAKAFQMPQNIPVNQPIALWDTNDQLIYWKSINQLGMPNPLIKMRYTIEESPSQSLLPASGASAASPNGDYVTKDDFERQMKELKEMLKNSQQTRNQNGGNNQQNRGGNT